MQPELVDADAGLGVRVGQVVGPDALVARLPGGAAVVGLEDAHRGDADPHPGGIGGMGHDGVEDEPAVAGLPVRSGGMVAQAGHVRPGRAAVVGAEEAGRLDARVEGVAGRGDVPDPRHRRAWPSP